MREVEHIYMNVPRWTGRKIEEGTPWMDIASELESMLAQLDSLLGEFGGIGFSSQMGTLNCVTDGINTMRNARKYLHEEIVRLVDRPLEECFTRAVEALAAIDLDEIRVANNAGLVVKNTDICGQNAGVNKITDYSLSDVLKGNVPELNRCVGYNQKIDGFRELIEEMGGFTLADLQCKNEESDKKTSKEKFNFFDEIDNILDFMGYHCESGHCEGPIGNPPQKTMEERISDIIEDVVERVGDYNILLNKLKENAIKKIIESPVSLNSWLDVYSIPSNDEGKAVEIPYLESEDKKYNSISDWYSFEGEKSFEVFESNKLNYSINEMGGIINEEGRYWISVGPKVLITDYADDGKVWASDFTFGTKVDIKLQNKETNEVVYIYAVVGDIRAHTYGEGDGIVHTGIPYPKSSNAAHGEVSLPNYSSVEFMRTWSGIPEERQTIKENLDNYNIVQFIVYE